MKERKDKAKNKRQLLEEIKNLKNCVEELKKLQSKQKKVEEKLKESEERSRILIKTIPDIIYEVDAKGRFIFVSNAIKELGYNPNELIGKHFRKITHPDDFEIVNRLLVLPKYAGKSTGDAGSPKLFDERRTAFRMTRDLQLRLLLKGQKVPSADYCYVEVSSSGKWNRPVQHKNKKFLGSIGIMRDITEYRKAEEGLRESKEFSFSLLSNSPHPVVVINPDTSIRYVNPALEELTGFSFGELVNKKAPYFWWTGTALKQTKKDFRRAMKRGAQKIEELFQRKNGKKFWVEITSRPIKDEREVKYYLENWIDITERKKAEEELRNSEMLFRTTVTGLPVIVFVLNNKGLFALSEGHGLEILDVFPKKVLGKSADEIFGDKPEILEAIKRAFEGQWNKSIVEMNDVVFSVHCSPILDSKGEIKGVIGLGVDITELKKAEEELGAAYAELKETQELLIQAEKFKAIGQLASGVAHEVKNPLGILIQDINYLEKNLPSKKDISDVFNMMKKNIKRADDIVRALVDFSRATELELKPRNINPILENSLNLVQHRMKLEGIEIIKKLKEDLPKVLLDKGKIEQVFVNLFLNAIQAMPDGGKLFIHSYLIELSRLGNGIGRRGSDYFKFGEKAVVTEIEDTGVGISKEDLGKIFEPFFSTKGVGEGIGLGLSVTRNIIEMHKGLIEIKSEEGKGTKVIITLRISGGK